MVDYFSLGITHLLMALAAWRLLLRADLDDETAVDAGDAPGRPGAPGDA